MSALTEQLRLQAENNHIGTDLGKLLAWAAMHIDEQDEALAEARAELKEESDERLRMEAAINGARNQLHAVCASLAYSQPVQIELARDHAPHINAMAAQGVIPYARKTRQKKVNA